MRDRNYQRAGDIFSVGAVGGFWGFCVVGVCSYFGPSIAAFGYGYLALSTFIGLLGKEQEKLMRRLMFAAIEKITGIKADEEDDELQELHHEPPQDALGQDTVDPE